MNEMLDRLQTAGERQRRFVADASHELKSPLATVQAELEVALAHPETADWEAAAARLLHEDERMERLVADLLFLAQCDDGAFSSLTVPAEVVALDAVVRDETDRLGQRWTVPVDVAVDIVVAPGGAAVAGHPEHLARVVRNLLENAARHARRQVTVTLRADGPAAGRPAELELVVADDGPGLDPADRRRVFDRFTRLDDARSRDEGGSGLALPIAREIVEAHGGRIALGDGPGGRFVVRLPRAPASAPGAAPVPDPAPAASSVGRELEDEPGSGVGGLDGDAPAVGDGDVPHDGQAEPRAGLFGP